MARRYDLSFSQCVQIRPFHEGERNYQAKRCVSELTDDFSRLLLLLSASSAANRVRPLSTTADADAVAFKKDA